MYKTFEHKPFDFPEFQQVYVNGKRHYCVDGKTYPSVTTVLSTLGKEKLDEWRARVGEEQAAIISRKAANRGTAMHKLCEDYVSNTPDMSLVVASAMPNITQLFKQIQPILDTRLDLVYNMESCLASHRLKTAGRADLLCQFDGINSILDYKSSDKPKKEEWIENYFIQCATYSQCVYEMKGILFPQIVVIIAVENEIHPQIFVRKTADYLNRVKEVFSNYHGA
jgi:genome maintenance exonuclease 1